MSSSSSSSTVTAQGLPTVLSDLPPIFTALYQSKVTKKLSFEQIASAIGRNEWYTAAIFYGQAKPDKDDLDKLSKALDVPREELETNLGEHFYPNRGVGEWPPKGELFPARLRISLDSIASNTSSDPRPHADPVVYRLYEALLVYAHPLKAIIHEKFGDGIMSAIDFYVGHPHRFISQRPSGADHMSTFSYCHATGRCGKGARPQGRPRQDHLQRKGEPYLFALCRPHISDSYLLLFTAVPALQALVMRNEECSNFSSLLVLAGNSGGQPQALNLIYNVSCLNPTNDISYLAISIWAQTSYLAISI